MDYALTMGGMPVAQATPTTQAQFLRRTYGHLIGAVLAFIAVEVFLFQTAVGATVINSMISIATFHRWAPLLLVGGFMIVTWVANAWAHSATSRPMQYAGLSLYVVAEAVLFAPLLYIASRFGGANIIPAAGLTTVMIFGVLTFTVFMTGKNFSFLAPALSIGGMAAFALIACSILFGFDLGLFFTVAMIVLASGYILYDTSRVLHEYSEEHYVAASLALFASVAMLFWYVLRLFMSLQDRE